MDAFTNAFSNAFDPNKNGVANTFAPLTSASTWNDVKNGAALGGMAAVDTVSPISIFGTGGVAGLAGALANGNPQPGTAPPLGPAGVSQSNLPAWLQGEFVIGGRQVAKLWVYAAGAAVAALIIL